MRPKFDNIHPYTGDYYKGILIASYYENQQ